MNEGAAFSLERRRWRAGWRLWASVVESADVLVRRLLAVSARLGLGLAIALSGAG